jgi:hypothetical protein
VRADIVVSGDEGFASGTEADERVILPDGVHYATGGGKDILCNSKGEIVATALSDGEGPATPDKATPEVDLLTLDDLAAGELPHEWNPGEELSDEG